MIIPGLLRYRQGQVKMVRYQTVGLAIVIHHQLTEFLHFSILSSKVGLYEIFG